VISQNKDGQNVKVVTNQYSTLSIDSIKGVKVYRLPFITSQCDMSSVKFYDVTSKAVFLNNSKTVEYFDTGNDSLVTFKDFQYFTENMLLSNERTYDNYKVDLERSVKYPFNFSDGICVLMKDNNIVNSPIEIIEAKGNKVISASKILYKDTLSMILPYINYSLNINNPTTLNDYAQYYTPHIKFEKYNFKGKLSNLHSLKDNITFSYIWGYNNQYPIAEIQNATITEVTNALVGTTPDQLSSAIVPDMTKIEALRTHPDLLKAHITTYTYKPLVGMTSKTDSRGVKTYYEYDEFNRLKYIKDTFGNIIQKFDYHYKE
jgi:hypothetical protein